MNAVRPAANPFASHRVESLRYRTNGIGWLDLQGRLEDLDGHAAIVGPKGSGKTTLLEEIAETLAPPVTWVRIPGNCPRPWRVALRQLPQEITGRHTILVDGSEQLGIVGWRWLLWRTRPCRRLIATLHKPGRLPTLAECRTSPVLLNDLVEELAQGRVPFSRQALDGLFNRHRGDIRRCLGELYDVYAGRSRMPADETNWEN